MSTHVDVHLVGQTIKQLRLNNHWTQWQLADAVGYSVRNLRRIESGETISIDTINAVADAFHVSAIDILSGCLFCFSNIKKDIGDLHPTQLTLICYSRTCTLG